MGGYDIFKVLKVLCFGVYSGLSLQTIILCIVGELAGEGPLALAVFVLICCFYPHTSRDLLVSHMQVFSRLFWPFGSGISSQFGVLSNMAKSLGETLRLKRLPGQYCHLDAIIFRCIGSFPICPFFFFH